MPTTDLRFGDWRDVLTEPGVTCDSLITDPPFSERTHHGQRSSGPRHDGGQDVLDSTSIEYGHVDEAYCRAFVESWASRVRYWWVIFGDDVAAGWWRDALAARDLYVFAAVPWCRVAGPRFTGDGPASGAEWITVARTRGDWATRPPWGSLPGYYVEPTAHLQGEGLGVVGQKPETLMRTLVRDYSRPGWTVCDPRAGTGTTLVAARAEGRHSIGSERDEGRYAIAARRIGEAYTLPMFAAR